MKLNRPKAVNFKPGDYPDSDTFNVCELKYDGIFGQLLLDGDSWQIWSRSGQLKRSGKLRSLGWRRTLIHSEFLYASEWSKDNKGLYGKLAVFGLEEFLGESVSHLTNGEVRQVLDDLIIHLQDESIENGLFLVEQHPIVAAPDLWKVRVLGQGYEGLIFKHSERPWSEGFGRMKRQETMDYVCIGFDESDSDTYAGWGVACVIGGLYVDGELQKVCKVSGLVNDLRKEFFDNPDKYIGKVFEAEGKKVSKKGALRHPNFMCWRDDKLPEECTWSLR